MIFLSETMEEFDQEPAQKKATNFAKYTGMAFQMLATIGVITFIGYKIDESRASDQMIFTAVFGLLSVLIALYQVVKTVKKG